MKILTWKARRKRKYTLIQLSELTGLSKSTLNNIENHITSPTIEQLEQIAIATNVAIEDLYESEAIWDIIP